MELMLTINWLYNRETSLDYPGGLDVITKVFIRRRHKAQRWSRTQNYGRRDWRSVRKGT